MAKKQKKKKRHIQLVPWVYHALEDDFEDLDFTKEIDENLAPGIYVIWHGEKKRENIIHVDKDEDMRFALSAHQTSPDILKHKENGPIRVARAVLRVKESRDKAVKYLKYLYFNEPLESRYYCVNSPI